MKFGFFSALIITALVVAVPQQGFAAKQTTTASAKKSNVAAKKLPAKKVRKGKKATQPRQEIFSALAVDGQTGEVLYEKNADALRYPASLTKMMTLYLTFEALKENKIDIKDNLAVSAKAAAQPQTNISLEAGDSLPLETAIESVVVRSANDSAMVLAEALGKTEFNFALMMTQKARELGMKNTVFRNPSGLPDNKQHTTAFDMARLAIALRRDFPEYYHYFKLTSFEHNGITYPGHNRVMERYAGADGVKTGFIRASGFNLVTSAKRDGHSIVAVIMGGSTGASRDRQMISLLDKTFEEMKTKSVASDKEANDNQEPSIKALEHLEARAN